ncbi:MAG: hypothetical protein JO004_10215 [Methylobacteriaceae bacterium]|nr:hypothetical protein [Methylobacteriaceae bacterium]
MRYSNTILPRGLYMVTLIHDERGRADGAQLARIDIEGEPPIRLRQDQFEKSGTSSRSTRRQNAAKAEGPLNLGGRLVRERVGRLASRSRPGFRIWSRQN